ncbi:MAG: tetratricopeptide repeat protein [Deltaproteobacteria bacterium]|nr:tetratricopeptide repeat protein [Deltaproteobacteria bacterium]
MRPVDERAIIGLALARYRLGDAAGALEAMQAAYQLPPNPLLVTMASYFALLAGRVEQARSALEAVSQKGPPYGLPHALLAQIYLIQNNKTAAQAQAAAALSESPNSPLALLTMGLVKMAAFDLPGATQYLERAVTADPRFVDAYVYLARIWLGSDNLSRAHKTIDRALRLAPRDGAVLSLAGFVRLAYRDYEGAKTLWDEAVRVNPRLGEPHLGLAIYQFRHRRFDQGLAEMLTATLLEPRVSLHQTSLGKALYQTRAFDRALEVFDYAKTLDPRDPTPHLYKGIALSDLNRPGEAIQEINRSIELNDHTAVFRTRLGLDRDLAVRNYNLARAYDQLGLKEWAFSKAVTAVKNDPYNSSAHLFLEKSYGINTPQGLEAINSEDLLFRLLAPANQSTFLNIRNDNYTPMFEMPYARVLAQGGVGSWRERDSIQDHSLVVYGGRPGLGFWVEGDYSDDRGFRAVNDDFKKYTPIAFLKWEPAANSSFLGTFQYLDQRFGDIFFPNDFGYKNQPFLRLAQRLQFYELGYVHRFNPKATLLTYFNYQKQDNRQSFPFSFAFPPDELVGLDRVRADRKFGNFQAQQNLVLGNHNFIAGFDYFQGRVRFNELFVQTLFSGGVPIFTQEINLDFRPPERTYSFYLLDYWRVHPKLLVELGIIKDFANSSREGFANQLYTSLWSPILGINFYATPRHTFRAAVQRHLVTHTEWAAPSLLPTETAGFPWLFAFLRNGTEVRDAGVSWEAEWDRKTFSVLKLEGQRFAEPNFNMLGQREWLGWKRYQASLTVNRILATSLGLSAGALGKRLVPDVNPVFTQPSLGPATRDFTEFRSFLALAFLHHTGWQGGIRTTLVRQWLKDQDNSLFGLVDLRFGKEFANKRGLATLEITNLLDRHFFHALEPKRFVNPDFFPARRILFKLALYF